MTDRSDTAASARSTPGTFKTKGLARPAIGQPAPVVELGDGTEGQWRLCDHRGRPVVLIFHRHIH